MGRISILLCTPLSHLKLSLESKLHWGEPCFLCRGSEVQGLSRGHRGLPVVDVCLSADQRAQRHSWDPRRATGRRFQPARQCDRTSVHKWTSLEMCRHRMRVTRQGSGRSGFLVQEMAPGGGTPLHALNGPGFGTTMCMHPQLGFPSPSHP